MGVAIANYPKLVARRKLVYVTCTYIDVYTCVCTHDIIAQSPKGSHRL